MVQESSTEIERTETTTSTQISCLRVFVTTRYFYQSYNQEMVKHYNSILTISALPEWWVVLVPEFEVALLGVANVGSEGEALVGATVQRVGLKEGLGIILVLIHW